MPILNIPHCDCLLAEKYAGKAVSKKNKDPYTTLKIELHRIPLDRDQLCAIMGEPHAFEALYNTGANPVEPFLKCLKELRLEYEYQLANVALFYEMGSTRFPLKDATLSDLRIQLRQGGESWLSMKVEAAPPLDRKLGELLERLGSGIECEIHADDPLAQTELPLNTAGIGEQPETGAPRAKRARKKSASRSMRH
jgi:hypothetical protein